MAVEKTGFRKLKIGLLRLILLTLLSLSIGCAHRPETGHIYAVGDVHGTIEGFTRILQKANLVNEEHQWIGGSSTLIQVGDFMDRGPAVRQVMDLLMSLEKQAKKQGGRVITLMGNHESSNLMGIYDPQSTPLPVFARICADFTDDSSANRRKTAYRQYAKWKLNYPRCLAATESEWMSAHPPGFIEYQNALNPEGKYGRWLRSLPAVAIIGNIAFVHGGLSPKLNQPDYNSPGKVNKRVKLEIDLFDRIRHDLTEEKIILPFFSYDEIECIVNRIAGEMPAELNTSQVTTRQMRFKKMQKRLPANIAWMHLNKDGPLWFRGYANWSEEDGNPMVDRLLKTWNVERIVVGHTPDLSGRIRNRFNSRIFLIDTGMVYGINTNLSVRPSVLEIRNGIITAIYRDGKTVLFDPATENANTE